MKGKKNPQTNEDGMTVAPCFAAVIDGVTTKSTLTYEGRRTGRLAMELALEAIHNFPKDTNTADATRRITERIYDSYVQHDLLDELEAEPGKRFMANGAIYSYARNEVQQVGDCQCITDNLYSSNEEEINTIMADVRAVVSEVALLDGATTKDSESHDPGRELTCPLLQRQAPLQNCPIQGQQFSFSVLDEFLIQTEQVKVFPVGDMKEVALASDGCPHLYFTLYASECYLADILEKDPLCIRLYKSTKGIQEGDCSFGDRIYLKIRINR